MFLLGAVVLTAARDVQTQSIAIKLQTRFSVAHNYCRVIDSQKQPVLLLPLPITFTRRELQNLQPVLVRIPEVKSLDAARVLVPVGQTLWTSRRVFDFVLSQQRISFIHVAGA